MRVIGSHDISLTITFCSAGDSTDAMFAAPCVVSVAGAHGYHRFWYPVVSCRPRLRHSGSWSYVRLMDCARR